MKVLRVGRDVPTHFARNASYMMIHLSHNAYCVVSFVLTHLLWWAIKKNKNNLSPGLQMGDRESSSHHPKVT